MLYREYSYSCSQIPVNNTADLVDYLVEGKCEILAIMGTTAAVMLLLVLTEC